MLLSNRHRKNYYLLIFANSVSAIFGGFFVGLIHFRLAFLLLGTVFILDTAPLFFLAEELPQKNKHV